MREPIVKSMPFYPSFCDAIEDLETTEEKLAAFQMLTDYGIYGIDPDEDISRALRLIFKLAKPNIDVARARSLGGQKGGRPRKEETKKPMVKPKVTSSNTKGFNDIKNKNREEDIENDSDSLLSSSLKREGDRAPAPADAAGASPLFTLEDFMECADENDLDMTEDEIRKCYQANRRKGFEPPKGKRSFSILGTLRGWHKNKAPAPDPEPAPAPKPKTKPKSKDEQVLEISRDYIPEELLEKYPDAKRTLTGAFCPKSAFLDRGREDLIEYLKDCGVWLSINPQGEKSPLYKNMIVRIGE